jgi:hypothetical protein
MARVVILAAHADTKRRDIAPDESGERNVIPAGAGELQRHQSAASDEPPDWASLRQRYDETGHDAFKGMQMGHEMGAGLRYRPDGGARTDTRGPSC